MIYKVPSNPNNSVFLGFYSKDKYTCRFGGFAVAGTPVLKTKRDRLANRVLHFYFFIQTTIIVR